MKPQIFTLVIRLLDYFGRILLTLDVLRFLFTSASLTDAMAVLLKYFAEFQPVFRLIGEVVHSLLLPYVFLRDKLVYYVDVGLSGSHADAAFVASLFALSVARGLVAYQGHVAKVAEFLMWHHLYYVVSNMQDDEKRVENVKRLEDFINTTKINFLLVGPVVDLLRGLKFEMQPPHINSRLRLAENLLWSAVVASKAQLESLHACLTAQRRSMCYTALATVVILAVFSIDRIYAGQNTDIIKILVLAPSFALGILLMLAMMVFTVSVFFFVLLLVLGLGAYLIRWTSAGRRIVDKVVRRVFGSIIARIWIESLGKYGANYSNTTPDLGYAELSTVTTKAGEASVICQHTKDIPYSIIRSLVFDTKTSKLSLTLLSGKVLQAKAELQFSHFPPKEPVSQVNLQFCPDGKVIDSYWKPISIR